MLHIEETMKRNSWPGGAKSSTIWRTFDIKKMGENNYGELFKCSGAKITEECFEKW